MEKTDKQTRMHACMWMPLVSSIKRQRVRVCLCVCASASVSSSKRNDNESTDTSKGPGKKEGAQKKGEKMQN